jgi:hypothetical protein
MLTPGTTPSSVANSSNALGALVDRSFGKAIVGLRTLHDGHFGDYMSWLVLGVPVFGSLCAATMR